MGMGKMRIRGTMNNLFRRVSTRRPWTSGRTLASFVTVTAFLVVACGGAASPAVGSSTDGESSQQAPVSSEKADRKPATDFELVLFGNGEHRSGEKISLSQFAGDPVVLNFWFPSCPPCVAEMPDFESAYQKYKSEGVQFIGIQLIGLDTVEDGQEFVDELGVNYLIGADLTENTSGDIIRSYNVSGFPTTVFIDRGQTISRKWMGALNQDKLDELVADLLN